MNGLKKKCHSLRKKMIAMNLCATVLSLIFCGAVFAGSVRAIVGEYIERDLDFFLTETNNNLNAKTEYLENIIYQIRNSKDLMNYLSNTRIAPLGEDDREELQETYNKVIDIGSKKNLGGSNKPILEKVYLFDDKENFLFTGYYAMLDSEIEKSEKDVVKIYSSFKAQQKKEGGNKDYCYYASSSDEIYLAYTLYSNEMNPLGVVIYEIRMDSLREIMEQVNHYKDGFWMLYDSQGKVLGGENCEEAKEELNGISGVFKSKPYVYQIEDQSYRLYTESMSMNLSGTIGIPTGQTQNLLNDSVSIYIFIIIIFTFGVFVVFAFVIYRMTGPLKDFTEKLKSVKEGDFETKLPEYDTEEFQEISLLFNEMTEYVNYLIKQVYEKQISIKEMELKFLQTQMNPHFLFNVLNTIALQAKIDKNEETYKMLTSFSQLIQAKIYRKDTEKVKIRQELEYVEYYLYLQSYRYGERLNYCIEIEDEDALDMNIPKLCLQLIVENAVVHGIEPKMEPGVVEIRLYTENESIYIEVSDNGVGFDQDGEVSLPFTKLKTEKGHNHVGLNNAHHIIQLMYGGEYGIKIYSEHGKGTRIIVHIPYDEE